MMQIKGTEGFAPIQTSAARRSSGTARTAAQDGYYDHFTVSSPGAQDRNSFREMVASLSYQVRTHNTTPGSTRWSPGRPPPGCSCLWRRANDGYGFMAGVPEDAG